MPTAAVVYRSATGTTRRLAEEIGAHLESRGITATVQSVGEADPASLAGVDLVLLGCWTSGLFVVAQHPDEPWMAFAAPAWSLPIVSPPSWPPTRSWCWTRAGWWKAATTTSCWPRMACMRTFTRRSSGRLSLHDRTWRRLQSLRGVLNDQWRLRNYPGNCVVASAPNEPVDRAGVQRLTQPKHAKASSVVRTAACFSTL